MVARPRRANPLGVALALCTCAAASVAAAPRMAAFERATAPMPGVGSWTSVALDAAGRAHVAWSDAARGSLEYAWQVPGGWRSETVESGEQGPVGWYASLALDAGGVAHLAYYDAAHGVLKHAERRSGSWRTEVVDDAGGAGHYCALALTPAGAPAVSYYDAGTLSLRYAEKVAGAWRRETVDGEGNAAEAVAAQDRADRASKTPAISGDVPNVGAYTSLAIGRDGTVHISYQDVTNADLKVAVRRGGAWTSETVDAKGDVGEHTSLKIDAAGRARVAYYDLQRGVLKLASEGADGAWQVETVDADGDVGAYASLALDEDGGAHVSYLDAARGALRYVEPAAGGGWLARQLDGEGDAGRNSSLALARDGAPVIAYTAVAGRGAFRLALGGVQSGGGRADDGMGRVPGTSISAWPLPYRGGELKVALTLPTGVGPTEVELLDVAGRRVRTLVPPGQELPAGSLTWDGRDDAGRRLANGVYFLVGRSGGRETRLKVVVSR